MNVLETRNKILEAALNNISQSGIDGATMKKIADDCDIKSASIYYFFKNKNALLKDTLKIVMDRHFESQLLAYSVNESSDLLTRLESLLDKIVLYHISHPIETSVYLHFINHSDKHIQDAVLNYQYEYGNWLKNILYEDYIKDENSDLLDEYKKIIDMFILLANGLFWETVLYSEEELDYQIELAKELIRLAYKKLN